MSGFAVNRPELYNHSRGREMLQRMGWKEGQGLGRANNGVITPLVGLKQDRFVSSSVDQNWFETLFEGTIKSVRIHPGMASPSPSSSPIPGISGSPERPSSVTPAALMKTVPRLPISENSQEQTVSQPTSKRTEKKDKKHKDKHKKTSSKEKSDDHSGKKEKKDKKNKDKSRHSSSKEKADKHSKKDRHQTKTKKLDKTQQDDEVISKKKRTHSTVDESDSDSESHHSTSPSPSPSPASYMAHAVSNLPVTPPPSSSPSLFQQDGSVLLEITSGHLGRSHNPKGKLSRIAEQERLYALKKLSTSLEKP